MDTQDFKDEMKKDGEDLGQDLIKEGEALGEKVALDEGEDLLEGKSADEMGADLETDAEAAGSALLADLQPDFEALEAHIPAPALNLLKEAGNKGLQAMEKYGPEEIANLEAAHQATFTAIHNKLTQFVASLEGIFTKS